MASRKHDFSEDDKIRVLLWCDRHCCLCGKPSGVSMEIAHLDPQQSDIDNAIPLCFDCHAAIGHYNQSHPRGRKYSVKELKARRDQIYDQHTQRLVPPVDFRLVQEGRSLPQVGFQITNLGSTYPVRARVEVNLVQGARKWGPPQTDGHYDGRFLWNLNPRFSITGFFYIPSEVLKNPEKLRARIDVTLVDIYERNHQLLPVGYVIEVAERAEWNYEPAVEMMSVSCDTSGV